MDALDLRIRQGELIAVIGPVGSGKSSLLESILGSMKKITGHIHKRKVKSWIDHQIKHRSSTPSLYQVAAENILCLQCPRMISPINIIIIRIAY